MQGSCQGDIVDVSVIGWVQGLVLDSLHMCPPATRQAGDDQVQMHAKSLPLGFGASRS